MSEQKRIASIVEPTAESKTLLEKLLDGVETVGNKVPHPAVIFFILAGLVIVLSHLFYPSITRWSIRRRTGWSMRPPPSTAC